MGRPPRLPIDVWVSDRTKPDLSSLQASVDEYSRQYDAALERHDFAARAEALWGLVARGPDAHGWCRDRLRSSDDEAIGDACGVLAWTGVPADLESPLQELLQNLPDGEARDSVYEILPERLRGEVDAVAEGAPPDSDLLGGSMEPFTSIIWYVEAPMEAILEADGKWSKGPKRSLSAVQGSLPELLNLLEPFAMPSWKHLWVETRAGWIAVFSQGSDLSYVDRYAGWLKTRVLRAAYHQDVKRGDRIVSYGGTSFWLSNGRREDLAPLYGLRSIQASRQSGWQWDVHGEVQPFEETERYERRRIAERFDLPMLNRYCAALGIRRNDPGFYGPKALLEEYDISRWPRPPRQMSSAQWRAEHSRD